MPTLTISYRDDAEAGARWKVEHVGPFVELGALAAGPKWQAFWDRN